MNKFKFLFVFALILFGTTSIFSQRGPGGISVETGTIAGCGASASSTCGLWLDASMITTLSDNSPISVWEDVSLSEICDNAVPQNNSVRPIFRNNPAYTINGFPTIIFENDRFFRINSSDDLNTEQVSFTRTIFFAFRTGDDVSSQQIIYEEGGNVRGYNVTIHDGHILIGAYDWIVDRDVNLSGTSNDVLTPRWGYSYTYTPVEPNTTYILTSKMFAAAAGVVASNDNYYIRGWLNGEPFTNENEFGSEHAFPHEVSSGLNDVGINGLFLGNDRLGRASSNPSSENGASNGGVGTLFDHPNPCGLGAINSDMVLKDEIRNNDTGQEPFTGLLAEMIVYRGEQPTDEVTDIQRTIVENYLSSKYLADIATDADKYDHQFGYGKDLIGIGRLSTNGPIHNLSQGRNPFLISRTNNYSTSANQTFMTGHNGSPLNWSEVGVPNNSSNIERLERIWRVDERPTNFSAVSIEVDLSLDGIMTPPPGYTTANAKLCLMVDESNQVIPDFTLASTRVIEMENVAPDQYEIDYNFNDNSFYTFAWVKPEISFTETESFSLEDTGPVFSGRTVEVTLNYDPDPSSGGFTANFELATAGTANLCTVWPPVANDDFYYNSAASGVTSGSVTISPGNQTASIPFRIINDSDPESPGTEDFTINLTSSVTPGLLIGANSSHVHTIYDDDPPPKIFFSSSQPNNGEWFENQTMIMRVNLTQDVDASFRVIIDGNNGPLPNARSSASGLDPDDYDYDESASNVFNYISGNGLFLDIPVTLIDDLVDEDTEEIRARIIPISGAAAQSSADIRFTFKILDNDVPIIAFPSDAQFGFETVGQPTLAVSVGDETDPNRVISSKAIVVNYIMTPGGTNPATYGVDYSGAQNGKTVIAPFAQFGFLSPFNVIADGNTETPEEVLFSIVSYEVIYDYDDGQNPVVGNVIFPPPSAPAFPNLTYTIYDYSEFEFRGVGGVGQRTDNVVWLDMSQEPFNNSNPSFPINNVNEIENWVPNFPNNNTIRIRRNGNNSGGRLIENGVGTRNALDFDGLPSTPGNGNPNNADVYTIDNDVRINTSAAVDKLSYFFAIHTEDLPTSTGTAANNSTCRLLYEQGGTSRGISIYLRNSRLYLHAWNNVNDDFIQDTDPNTPGDQSFDGNEAPWGRSSSSTSGNRAVVSSALLPDTDYIISCHYENKAADPRDQLRIYVNGRKFNLPSSATDQWVGRLYAHGGRVGLGAVRDNTLLHYTSSTPGNKRCAFNGNIAEFIMFYEPEMNEARRVIVENYLAGKYDVTLFNTNTPIVFDNTAPNAADFKNNIAGIGQISATEGHVTGQGPYGLLQVRGAGYSSTNPGYLVWGDNGEELTNTYPYSGPFAALPPTIEERSGTVWKMFRDGAATTATDILINFSASNNREDLLSGNLLRLMYHTDDSDPNNFGNATVRSGTMESGYVARFSNVPITDGMYIALGNTSPLEITPLPIELLSFDARLNGKVVDLTWSTATETNNEFFVIERAGRDLVWEEILRQDGAGNSTSTIHYSDVDRSPLSGTSYYRLKQIDYDGSFTYSDVKSVLNLSNGYEDSDISVFPNPTQTGNVYLSIPVEFNESLTTVSLINISGQTVWQDSYKNISPVQELQIGDLPPGLYIIQAQSSENAATTKLVIQN